MAINGILLGQNNNNNNNSSFQVGDICETAINKEDNWHICDGSQIVATKNPELHAALANSVLDSTFGYLSFESLNTAFPEDLLATETNPSATIIHQHYNLNIMALTVQIISNAGLTYYLYYLKGSSLDEFQEISNYTKIRIGNTLKSYQTNIRVSPYVFSGSTGTEIAFMLPNYASSTYARGRIYIISTSSNSIIKSFTSITSNRTSDSTYYDIDFFFCNYSSSQKVYYCGTTAGEIFISISDSTMELRAFTDDYHSVRYFTSYYYNVSSAMIIACRYKTDLGSARISVFQPDISELVNNYTSSRPAQSIPSATIDNAFGNNKSTFYSSFLPVNGNNQYAYFLDAVTGKGWAVRSSNNSFSFTAPDVKDLVGVICLSTNTKPVFIYKKPNYFLLRDETGSFIKIVLLKNNEFPSNITNRYPINSKGFMILETNYIQIPSYTIDNPGIKKYIKIK